MSMITSPDEAASFLLLAAVVERDTVHRAPCDLVTVSKSTDKPTNEKTGKIMSIIQAIELSAFGGPDVLEAVDVPPTQTDDEARRRLAPGAPDGRLVLDMTGLNR
jgi:hypothetical protein